MRRTSLTILADDLTGACDAAAPFATASHATLVLLDVRAPPPAVRVAGYDLDLRECSPEETYAGARRAAARCSAGAERLFAKIDSTLRGNLAEFCSGVLDGAAVRLAVIAPAFPRQGRRLVNGRLVMSGGAEADAVDLNDLLSRAGERVLHVPLQGGIAPSAITQALARASADAIRIIVVDTDSDHDLKAVAQAASDCAEPIVLAGSGGLAQALVDLMPRGVAEFRVAAPPSGPILVLAGSPAPATRRQINHLIRQPDVHKLRVGEDSIDFEDGDVLVVATCPEDEALAVVRDGARSSALLARYAARLAELLRPRALVLVGGTSARAACRALDVHALELLGEVAPGLPRGVLRGGKWDGMPVVTKSGGFGSPTLLAEAVRWYKEECA